MPAVPALEIVTVDSPKAGVLRRKARPVGKVTREVQGLIEQMFATMRAVKGLGLAAPQIGESIRALVAQVEDRTVVLVDPQILSAEGKETATEACLSIPGVIGDVPRAATITVRGKNRRGRRITIIADGLLARALQHEIDHLDGILFLDRVIDHDTIRIITPADDSAPATE
ncbi:MAG: peptide deformylase [Armatimonadota bacterium]